MVDSSRSHDFNLVITLNPDAPRDLQILGEQYWEHKGLHPDRGTVRWTHKISEIDHTAWANSLYHAAAAGVRASAPAHSCAQCQEVLTLGSRTSLEEALRGEEVKCRDCNPLLDKYVAKVLDPEERAKREQIVEQKREHARQREDARLVEQAQREAAKELDTLRRDVLETRYASTAEGDGEYAFAHASIKAKLGALAVLHAVSHPDGLIYPVNFSNGSIAPNDRMATELFVEAWQAGLFLIHPSSPPDSFVWDEQNPLELGEGVYIERAHFMVPGEEAPASRREFFVHKLRAQLRLEALSADNRVELQDLLRQLMAVETVRFFKFCLDDQGLPVPASHHMDRVQTYLEKGVETTSLGVLWRIAWSAARDARLTAVKYTMKKSSAATYSANRVIQYVERIITDPEELTATHREDTRVPLSGAIKIIFLILGVPPMTTMPAEIADILADAPDEELRRACDNRIPDRVELLARLEADESWSPQQFREALESVSTDRYEICATGCAHDLGLSVAAQTLQFYEGLSLEESGRTVALIAAEATGIGNENSGRGRGGDFVLAEVVRRMGVMSAN